MPTTNAATAPAAPAASNDSVRSTCQRQVQVEATAAPMATNAT